MNGPGSSGTAITYNPASQLTGITRTNVTDLYAWTGHYNINRAYGTNGLNQLTSAGSTALGYDGRGNLTSSGPSVYTYTSENRFATAPGGTTLTYDPTGRLSRVVKGLNDTQFEYLGPRLIIERDATGNILRRYVHGPGDDEPVVWYESSALTNKRFLHTDERGSVIALSDLSGASTATNKYDEYGIPQSSVGTLAPGTSGRFMYTGQTWIAEVGFYYYKARFYSPTLGRFMQTDPIGYKDGINWYDYVGNDPVNAVDPDGKQIITGVPNPKVIVAAAEEVIEDPVGVLIDGIMIIGDILSVPSGESIAGIAVRRGAKEAAEKVIKGGHNKARPSTKSKHQKADGRRGREQQRAAEDKKTKGKSKEQKAKEKKEAKEKDDYKRKGPKK